MTICCNPAPTSDIYLLLRAHGEQHWMLTRVVPVVRQLERREELPEAQLGAALACLEVLWIEARALAAETDAAFERLATSADSAGEDRSLHEKARRYHAAARRLRASLAQRVERLLAADGDEEPRPGGFVSRPRQS